jgi:cystathionine gamma-lyase
MGKYGFSTRAIHGGEKPDFREGAFGDVVVPIHLSTTYARKEVDIPTAGYEYSRFGNPTRDALEAKLASLENAKYGLAFASGLAAETTVLFSLLKSGDHIIAFDDLYGGTKRLFNRVIPDFNISVTYVDASVTANVEAAIKGDTKLIWLESPTNPMLKLSDIAAIATLAKNNGILVVVDNTFLSPYFQNPLDLGADIVLHSSTKYINGHSDVISGSLMLSNEALYEKLKFNQNAMGAILSPFDSFMVSRGIKTLALRMEQHNKNALMIANYLEKHPKVTKVYYPGLESHPQHQLAKQQARGFGGIISFEINGTGNQSRLFLQNLQLFALAESLGGVESLIELPDVMTHASVPVEDKLKAGITESLIRVSVGVEDAGDLIADLEQAFDKL